MVITRRKLLQLLPLVGLASVTTVEGHEVKQKTIELSKGVGKHYLIVLSEPHPPSVIERLSTHFKECDVSATILYGDDPTIYELSKGVEDE